MSAVSQGWGLSELRNRRHLHYVRNTECILMSLLQALRCTVCSSLSLSRFCHRGNLRMLTCCSEWQNVECKFLGWDSGLLRCDLNERILMMVCHTSDIHQAHHNNVIDAKKFHPVEKFRTWASYRDKNKNADTNFESFYFWKVWRGRLAAVRSASVVRMFPIISNIVHYLIRDDALNNPESNR